MPKAIDAAHRQQVVDAYLSRKAKDPSTTYASVAEEFGVGQASLSRWLGRQRRQGTVEAKKTRDARSRRRLTEEQGAAVAAWVLANPTRRLWEVQAWVEQEFKRVVSLGAISNELRRRNIGKRRLTKLASAPSPGGQSTERNYNSKHRRTPEARPHRRAYPSDFTNAEWATVEPLWREFARSVPQKHALREVLEALRYIGATGCPWRFLPNDFPPHSTVRAWFDTWTRDGTIAAVNDALRRMLRRRAGREETPSILIIDSQTIKTQEGGEARGYDGGKKINGRKRHIGVDTLGLPWRIVVHGADIQDRDGLDLVAPANIKEELPRLEKLLADAGYQGRAEHLTLERTGVPVEIVRRRGDAAAGEWSNKGGDAPSYTPGFHPLPKRWIVERSFGWAIKRRRLARDYERTARSSKAWIELAFQNTMTARAAA